MKKFLSVMLAGVIVMSLAAFAACDESAWSFGPQSQYEFIETSGENDEQVNQTQEEEKVDENFEFAYLEKAVENGWLTKDHIMHVAYYSVGYCNESVYDEIIGEKFNRIDFAPTKESVTLSSKQEAAILNAYYGLRKGYFAKGEGVEVLSCAKYCGKYNGVYVLRIEDPTVIEPKTSTYKCCDIYLGNKMYIAAKQTETESKGADIAEKTLASNYVIEEIHKAYELGLITKTGLKNLSYYTLGNYYKKSEPETGAIALPVDYKPTETLVTISNTEADTIITAFAEYIKNNDGYAGKTRDDIKLTNYYGTFDGAYVVELNVNGYIGISGHFFVDDVAFFGCGFYVCKPIES